MAPSPAELKPPISPEIVEVVGIIKRALEGLTKPDETPEVVGIVADRGQDGVCVHPLVEVTISMGEGRGYLHKTVVLGDIDFAESFSTERQHDEPSNGITVDFGEWVGKLVYKTNASRRINLGDLTPGDRRVVIFPPNTGFSLERNLIAAVKEADYPLLVEGLKRAAGVI